MRAVPEYHVYFAALPSGGKNSQSTTGGSCRSAASTANSRLSLSQPRERSPKRTRNSGSAPPAPKGPATGQALFQDTYRIVGTAVDDKNHLQLARGIPADSALELLKQAGADSPRSYTPE